MFRHMTSRLKRSGDRAERQTRGRRPIRMRRLHGLVLTAALLGALTACGDDTGNGSGADDATASQSDLDLSGRTFVSESVQVNGKPFPLAAGTTLALGFEDDAIQANAGCNQMTGQGTYADGTLDVGAGLATTQMACDPPEKMDQEQWYGTLLAAKPTLELDGDQLVLTSGDTVITYTEQAAASGTSLTGTLWTLDGFGTSSADGADGSMSSVPAGVTSTLQISDAGELNVDTGCNVGGASVRVDDSVIEVGPLSTTMKFCEGSEGEVEQAVVTVLEGEVAYSIDGEQLTLTKGGQTLSYRAS